MTLPTNRTALNTVAEHLSDHNTAHGLLNGLNGTYVALVGAPTGVAATDRAMIQTKLDAVRAAGSGELILSAGTYLVDLVAHPVNASYLSALTWPTRCKITGQNTKIKLAPSQAGLPANFAAVILNYQLNGGDIDMTMSDVTIDGDAANQTNVHHGVALIRAQSVHHDRVRVTNCRGTAGSGASENFHFEAELSSDISYTGCKAFGTAGSTSSGFSANGCIDVRYASCVASGMTVANGFTHNGCRHVKHTACHSFLNAGSGFNSEVSDDVSYDANCVAGGTTLTSSWPYTSGQSLGNTGNGFTMNGTTRFQLIGCTGENQAASTGLFVQNAATGTVVGGAYRLNLNGIGILAGCTVTVIGPPTVSGNTGTDWTNGFYSALVASAATITGTSRFIKGTPTNALEIATSGNLLQWASNGGKLTGYASDGASTRLEFDPADTPADARIVSDLFNSAKHIRFKKSGSEVFSVDWNGNPTAPSYTAAGLTGAVAASRYAGGTATAAPTTGTFAAGDFVITQTGLIYICTGAGTPGTWVLAQTGAYTPVPGAWTALTLLNSWVNFGGALQVAQYRLNGTDVEVRGTIKSGAAGSIAFQLPAGARPLAEFRILTLDSAGVGEIVVAATGDATINQQYGVATTLTSLHGLRFSTL